MKYADVLSDLDHQNTMKVRDAIVNLYVLLHPTEKEVRLNEGIDLAEETAALLVDWYQTVAQAPVKWSAEAKTFVLDL